LIPLLFAGISLIHRRPWLSATSCAA